MGLGTGNWTGMWPRESIFWIIVARRAYYKKQVQSGILEKVVTCEDVSDVRGYPCPFIFPILGIDQGCLGSSSVYCRSRAYINWTEFSFLTCPFDRT